MRQRVKMNLKKTFLLLVISSGITSCATLFGSKVDSCQTSKPLPGENKRTIRILPFILDIPFGLITDFATGAIYKPCSAPPPGTFGKSKK